MPSPNQEAALASSSTNGNTSAPQDTPEIKQPGSSRPLQKQHSSSTTTTTNYQMPTHNAQRNLRQSSSIMHSHHANLIGAPMAPPPPLQHQAEDEFIPLPIQTFLWRNTNPFVKPREKRESGNVIEQRDSCKLFERIIITNNVWGQSPSLTDAIASIDRWRLIKVSFPFVLQSTANQLNNKFIRDYTLSKMGSNESKMLYCLQWILMNASEECADSENEAKQNASAAVGGGPTASAVSSLLKPLGVATPATSASNSATGRAGGSQSGSASVSPAGAANLAAGCLTGAAAVAAGIAVGQALVSQGSLSSAPTDQANQQQQQSVSNEQQAAGSIATQSAFAPTTVVQADGHQQAKTQITLERSISVSPIGSSTPTKPLTPTIPNAKANNNASQQRTNLLLSPPAASVASQQQQQATAAAAVGQSFIPSNHYLLPISSIQMFVYYFAPLMEPLEMSDFLKSNQRLEIGVALWEPLFKHELPNVQCLNAPVKLHQRTGNLTCPSQNHVMSQQQQHQDSLFSNLNQAASVVSRPLISSSSSSAAVERRRSSAAFEQSHQQHQMHSSLHQQSQFGDVFIGGPNNSGGPNSCRPTGAQVESGPADSGGPSGTQKLGDSEQADELTTGGGDHPSSSRFFVQDASNSSLQAHNEDSINYATYLDVAVLRCLFMNNWQESGVFWALRYTSKRLDNFDYSEATRSVILERPQSKSLPDLYSAGLQFLELAKRQMQTSNKEFASDADWLMSLDHETDDFVASDDFGPECSAHPKAVHNSHRESRKQLQPANGDSRKQRQKLVIQKASTSQKLHHHRSSRRSSSAEDLTGKLSEMASLGLRSNQNSNRLVKKTHTLQDLELVNQNFGKHQSRQDKQQQRSSLTIDQDHDDAASMARVEHQFLLQSLYLKSLRRLDRLTRSFSVPKNMNYSSVAQHAAHLTAKSAGAESSATSASEPTPESLAAANYIDFSGRLDPVIILKLAHSITQRESVCSLRVCDELLSLVYTLIDIGILSENFHFNMNAEKATATGDSTSNDFKLASLLPTREQDFTMLADMEEVNARSKFKQTQRLVRRQLAGARTKKAQCFKMLIDISFYLYHHSGCPNRCGLDSLMDQLQHAVQSHKIKFISATVKQPSQAASSQNIIAEDQNLERQFKPKLRRLLVSLYEHDQEYFIMYVKQIIESRTLQEIVDILHSILGFCRSDYITSLTQLLSKSSSSAAAEQQAPTMQHHQQTTVSFCDVHDSLANESAIAGRYNSSGGAGGGAAAAALAAGSTIANCGGVSAGVASGPLVEAEILNSVFKLLVTRMADVNKKLKLLENTSLYCDIRRLIGFVRDTYNGLFRKILLSSLIDCTKIMNEQQREDASKRHQFNITGRPSCIDATLVGPPSDDESGSLSVHKQQHREARTLNPKSHHHHHSNDATSNFETSLRLEHCERPPPADMSLGHACVPATVGEPLMHRPSQNSEKFHQINQNSNSRQHPTVQMDSQQQQQTSGILSLSKAKKKLEQVFGAGSGSGAKLIGATDSSTLSVGVASGSTDIGPQDAINACEPGRKTSLIGAQSVGSFQHHESVTSCGGVVASSASTVIQVAPIGNDNYSIKPQQQRQSAVGDQQHGSTGPSPMTSLLVSGGEGANLVSRKLFEAMHTGMGNFSFLMESSPPGEFLDPALLAALLDLKSPVAIRAAIFLECSNLVHRCNRGQWPSWMKMSVAGAAAAASGASAASAGHGPSSASAYHHRASTVGLGPASQVPGSGQPSLLASSGSKYRKSSSMQRSVRNNTLMYRAAGKAFYSWAEAIGVRLEEMLLAEMDDGCSKSRAMSTDDVIFEDSCSSVNNQAASGRDQCPSDATTSESTATTAIAATTASQHQQATTAQQLISDNKQHQPVTLSNVSNIAGDVDFFQPTIGDSSSPFALKMAACQLLFEVTTFLRETYRYLPPSIASHQVGGSSKLGDKMSSIYDVSRAVTANRRWSMALSSLGFGQLPATLSALSSSVAAAAAVPTGHQLKTNATSSSIPEDPSERRISFVLHESHDEKEHQKQLEAGGADDSQQQQAKVGELASSSSASSQAPLATAVTTSDQQQEAIRKMTGRNLSQSSASNAVVVAAATCLLRSSGMIETGAHRRKSIKLKKQDNSSKEPKDAQLAAALARNKTAKFGSQAAADQLAESEELAAGDSGSVSELRRTDSMRSRRRVSGISERSDASEQKNAPASNAAAAAAPTTTGGHDAKQHHVRMQTGGDPSDDESLGNGSCDEAFAQESIEKFEADQSRIMSNMPWFKAISLINANIDCECQHFPQCKPQCYKLHQNMCKRLILSVQTIYSSGSSDHEANLTALFEAKLAALVSQHSTAMELEQQAKQQSAGGFTRAGSDCSAQTLEHEILVNGNLKGGTTGANNKRPSREKQATPSSGKQARQHNAATSDHEQQSTPAKGCGRKSTSHNKIWQQSHIAQSKLDQASLLETLRALNLFKSHQSSASKKQQHQQADELPILRYLRISVKNFLHCPMSAFLKGAVILHRDSFVEMIKFSWNLLLEDDQQLSRTAAVCFIIASIKCPAEATELLMNELACSDASKKIAAIQKFHVVWDARYQCWPRLEDGAFVHFKMAPPSIEFTLPSPKIAQESKPVVDPPWMPRRTSNVEEVTIGQDQTVQRSFVTATKTRRKQQIEIVNRALREKHDKLRQGRESYHLTSAPVTLYAAYEPTLLGGVSPAGADELDGVVGSSGGGNSSGGGGNVPGSMGGSSGGAGGAMGANDDETTQQESRALIQMKTAQALFPTCLCQAAIVLINLLDDSRVTYEGSAVYEVANKVIWSCLVEDPSLFLRYFFERLTRQNQSTIFQVLRRLIRFMPKLPPQAAFTLYNYLIGFVIYYIRSPVAISQKLIAETLSVLCFVVPSVYALFLKDLKQIFRKEQCDNALLITANVPSAKKIIVHGSDSSGIPSQFPIDETTQFYHILIDSLEFFGVKKEKQNEYFLIDVRTQQMHNLHSYVRDHYSFKRSQHPQLQLISMNPDRAFHILQRQELTNQFLEFGKVLMTHTIVKSSHMAVGRALFLHEELMKLPTFPRRALETNFSLFRGTTGHQVFSMDRMHKVCWVKAISRMFELTSGFFLQLGEIHLFLNAISGVFVLHCEEAAVSRLCLATFINAAHHFKNIFATDGFTPIMSTIVQVYSNHQNNHLLCRTIEFVCKQFYIMHRKPFLLQLFGSVASRLNTAEILQQNQTSNPISANSFSSASCAGNGALNPTSANGSPSRQQATASALNANAHSNHSGAGTTTPACGGGGNFDVADPSCISPNAFFRLLQSLEKAFKDPLDILELVEAEKPLKAVDFCYQQDKEVIDILDIISLCVTVTAYASDSPRSTQMLIILETVVPLYMKHLQAATSKKAGQSMGKQAHKDELQKIQSISVCIRTLIVNCDGLTRSFSGPLPYIDFKSSSIRHHGTLSSGGGGAGGGVNSRKQQGGASSGPARQQSNQTSNLLLAPDMNSTTDGFSRGDWHEHSQRWTGGPGAQSRQATILAPSGPASGGGAGGGNVGGGMSQKMLRNAMNTEESEILRGEFIVPRDTLLNLTAEFLSLSTVRLVESAKKYVDLHQKHSSYELLDVKSHLKLAEVANSLLKFASTDPSVMACRGLTRYMNEILPNTEWRQEAIRPALIMILKRLDKTFNRIAKKNSVKRQTDWEGAKQLLKGAYLTFIKHPYIVHLPHLKSLISCCQNIILSDSLTSSSHLLNSNFFQGLTQVSASAAAVATATSPSQQQQQGVPATAASRSQQQASISQSASMHVSMNNASHQQVQQTSTNKNKNKNNLLRVASQLHASGTSLGPSNSSNQLQQQQQHHAPAPTNHSSPDSQQAAAASPATACGQPKGGPLNPLTGGGKSLPSFVTTVAAAALAERLAATAASATSNSVTSQAFNSVTVRLIAMQLLQAGDSQTLESLIGNSMNTPEKLESVTLNLIYPMCIRVCSGSRDAPKLRPCDITFILNIVLSMLAPHSPSSKSCASNANSPKATSDTSQFILSKITTTIGSTQTGAMGALGIVGSSANSHSIQQMQQQAQFVQHRERLKIAFLGLKILCVCFESHLASEWVRISRVIRDLTLEQSQPTGCLWDFLDFVATYRFPLLVLLLPTIKCDLAREIRTSRNVPTSANSHLDDETQYNLQCYRLIEAKISGLATTVCRSRSFLFVSLAAELRMLKEQLIAKRRAQLESSNQQRDHRAQDHNSGAGSSGGGVGGHNSSVSGHNSSATALGGHRQSASGGGGSSSGGQQAGGANPEHFSTYHRLSAAIAMFANQPRQSSQQGQPVMTSAALKASSCFAAQLAAPSSVQCGAASSSQDQASSSTSSTTGGGGCQSSSVQLVSQTRSPEISQEQSQNSTRLSTAKSREEARAVMNTILRRTSYPHHNPMGSPEHRQRQQQSSGQANANVRAAAPYVAGQVDLEAGSSRGIPANLGGSSSSSVIINPATLMKAGFVAPKPRNQGSSGDKPSVLKQLVNTIDKRNKEQGQDQK